MKVFTLTLAALLAATGLGAQPLNLGSTEASKQLFPLVEKVLKDGGVEAKVTALPQARMLQSLGTGEIDGAFFLSDQGLASAKGAVKVPVKLFQIDIVAVSTGEGIKIASAADLKNYTVGIVRGNAAAEAVTKGLKVQLVDGDENLFKTLGAGRFQVAVTTRTSVPVLTKAAGITSFTVHEPSVVSIPLYFALSSKQASLAPKVEAVFKKWVDNGAWTKGVADSSAPKN